MKKILLVSPKAPTSYWGMEYVLPYLDKKTFLPPLGLLTVAGFCPREWDLRLIDLNVQEVADEDLLWADIVFIGGIVVQKVSLREVLDRCKKLGVKTLVGGTYVTSMPEAVADADYLVHGEIECVFDEVCRDIESGNLHHMYDVRSQKPDLARTPTPRWDLLLPMSVDRCRRGLQDYLYMSIQFSRGCPHDCEFCDVSALFGRKMRWKPTDRILRDLDALYGYGWRGPVILADDNIVGDSKAHLMERFGRIAEWQRQHNFPFPFTTQSTIRLADDLEVVDQMVQAGMQKVLLGIETPSKASLREANKMHNLGAEETVQAVHRLQRRGLEIPAGIIVGFDSDHAAIFDEQIDLITKSGIAFAMIGMLGAPAGTRLWKRLESEGRLIEGDTVSSGRMCSPNFITKMPRDELIAGYKKLISTVYDPDRYLDTVYVMLDNLSHATTPGFYLDVPSDEIKRGIAKMLVLSPYRWPIIKFLLRIATHHPRMMGRAINRIVMGYHFWEYTQKLAVPSLDAELETIRRNGPPKAQSARQPLVNIHADAR